MNNKLCLLALHQMPGIGPRTILRLLTLWPALKDCFSLSFNQLKQARLPDALSQAIHQVDWKQVESSLQFEQSPGHHILTWEDPLYPPLLKEIYDAPPVLYAIGDLSCLSDPLLAMVGSRHPSPTGRETAYQWANQLSQHPLTIVSGLALGIDAAAHQGCLAANGRTIAVLGTGVDVIYPSAHAALAKKITQRGLLISEFPLKTTPKAGHFPRRNRIISGLSMATLVIEATLKSGSLITARLAMEQNRGVLTLPGSIHLPQAQGCHYLIKQGATLVTNYQEVLEEIGVTAPAANKQLPLPPRSSTPDRNVNAIETRVLKSIGFELTPVDRIIQRCDLQPNQVASALATLEVQGFISQLMGGYIRLGT